MFTTKKNMLFSLLFAFALQGAKAQAMSTVKSSATVLLNSRGIVGLGAAFFVGHLFAKRCKLSALSFDDHLNQVKLGADQIWSKNPHLPCNFYRAHPRSITEIFKVLLRRLPSSYDDIYAQWASLQGNAIPVTIACRRQYRWHCIKYHLR